MFFRHYSSAPRKEQKKVMAIPRWKQTTIDKSKPIPKLASTSKPTPIQAPSNHLVDDNASVNKEMNNTTTAPFESRPNASENNVFKLPQPPIVRKNFTQTANRDPRMTRSVFQGNGLQMTIQNNNVERLPTQPPNTSNIKSRLGWNNHHNNRANATGPTVQLKALPPMKSKSNVTARPANIDTFKPNDTQSAIIAPTVSVLASASSVATETDTKTETASEPTSQLPKSPQPNLPQNVTPEPFKSAAFALPSFAMLTAKAGPQLTYPSFAIGPQQFEPPFSYLFKRMCRSHMHNACENQNECGFEHVLPDHKLVRKSLDKMYQKSVIDLYDNYMRRNQKLFEFYFDVFCDFFADHNLCDKLKQMVDDCNERRSQFHFGRIVDGFIKTGQSYVMALGTVITSVTKRQIGSSREIIQLILNPRNDNIRAFIGILDSIVHSEQVKFRGEWVNTLLLIHNEKNVLELGKTICKLVSDKHIVANVNSEFLTKFYELYSKSQ